MEGDEADDFEFDDLFHFDHGLSDSNQPINDEIQEDRLISSGNLPVELKDFQVLQKIGQGGYGTVVLAQKGEILFAIKAMKKGFILKTDAVHGARLEREVMRIRHPFIVPLHYAFQEDGCLFLVMDFVRGGQLFSHLQDEAMFSEVQVKFYAAETVLALEHLHGLGIIHRDLKPENVLIDEDGHLLLSDFGISKKLSTEGEKALSICGTAAYKAPEMIRGQPYCHSIDWWSLGILIFEMLTGDPPWKARNENALNQQILKGKLRLPTYLSFETHSILKGLLNRCVSKRLGFNGAVEIKRHPFFRGINWDKLYSKEMAPPIKPNLTQPEPTLHNLHHRKVQHQAPFWSPNNYSPLTQSQEDAFLGFSYARTPIQTPPKIRYGEGIKPEERGLRVGLQRRFNHSNDPDVRSKLKENLENKTELNSAQAKFNDAHKKMNEAANAEKDQCESSERRLACSPTSAFLSYSAMSRSEGCLEC